MGSSLFGSSKSSTQVPPWLQTAMRENLDLANRAGQVGFVPYTGPVVAGLSPGEIAARDNANAAASAFGLSTAGGGYMPQPTQFAGGFTGYSAKPLYDEALAGIDPAQRAAIEGMFAPAAPAAAPVVQSSGGGGSSYSAPMPAGGGAGYTGLRDMFDGGGPGASGDTFSGGGLLSDIANARAARRAS